ncbi:MAG TPA: hypothetical protein ENG03_11920 [Thioploca sp.]|nr:MAG: hypothetical protein DRR19_02820 [Gammaproteobacteria bacterium]HDN27776.1 hypothetical protein [Thioploca sp.]
MDSRHCGEFITALIDKIKQISFNNDTKPENMRSFKEWTLAELDKTFRLDVLDSSTVLEHWLTGQAECSDFERQVLRSFQKILHTHVHDWNETELAYNFIGPVMAFANFFAERAFSGTVDEIEMGGRPDGMIASGFRKPEQPYFCFQAYKKETDPEGDPAAQALAAMLVAQELNQHRFPVYGCYVKGEIWHFMTLQERAYCISDGYVATRDDLLEIFRMLKVLKQLITGFVESNAQE